jgi:serine protease
VAVASSVAVTASSANAASGSSGKAAQNAQYAANLAAVKAATAGHAYRHGVVPSLNATTAAKKAVTAAGPTYYFDGKLHYNSGTDGEGVQTSAPKVYIVYLGSQWGTASTSGGDTLFSGDTAGMAKAQQDFFRGLGSNSEKWSNVATQYCQGVATGAFACPVSAQHVAAASGGVLAGVWYDNSTAVADSLTANQIAQEAAAAAAHFGNTTAASNANAQYIVTFPTGTHPDGWDPTGSTNTFCAWHDYTGDPSMDGGGAITSPSGDIAFTLMPYLPDAQNGICGQDFVNGGSAGNLDGVSIVGGHEYAETQTDPFPNSAPGAADLTSGGWLAQMYDQSGTPVGQEEIGDLCAWMPAGPTQLTGHATDLNLSTGSFAVQGLWSNSDHNCATAVQTVDFNGDLLTDVAGIDANNNLMYYAGDGQGHVTGGANLLQPGGLWKGFKQLVAGDFNGDGNTDIAGIDANNNLSLYAGDGHGHLTPAGLMWPAGGLWAGFKEIVAGDFRGNGITDIAGIDANNDLHLYTNDGHGHLSDGGYMWPKGGDWAGFKQIVAGDFRGDGITDIAGIDANNDLKAYHGNGTGQLDGTSWYVWPKGGDWGGFKRILAGDFNSDNITDIAGIDANNNLKLYQGIGNGTLTGGSLMWPAGGDWAGFKLLL